MEQDKLENTVMDNSDAAKTIAQIDSLLIAGLAVAVSATNNPFTEIPVQMGTIVVLMLILSLWGILAYITFEILKDGNHPESPLSVPMIHNTHYLLLVSILGTLTTLIIIMMTMGYYYIL